MKPALFTLLLVFIVCAILGKMGYHIAKIETGKVVKAKVLENATVTYAWLNDEQYSTLKNLDTVWLDLAKHEVNDTAENTMMAVLLIDKR